ncbi:MAG: hypothetical protein IPG69_02975 [Flavobacteriales bacterium]|nr:hypothetical protein [Flavobacteriales bacterium]
MLIRTVAVAGLLLGLQHISNAQDPALPRTHSCALCGSGSIRLDALLQLRPEQVEECRMMLTQHETAVFEQRETIRRETARLDMQQAATYQTLVRALDPEQREKLTKALKNGKLPFSMETAEPGGVRGQSPAPSEKGSTKTKTASTEPKSGSTTLSR